MSWMLDQVLTLLGLGFLLVFVMALLSPFEALGWWAGWSRREVGPDEPPAPPGTTAAAAHYVVYLTGIGGFSGEFLARREIGFLERLTERVPDMVIVRDVFPFSVSNNPLNGERLLARVWQWVHDSRLKTHNILLELLIDLRNLLQVLVSADPRYGPLYNVGVAREIARSLLRHGYPTTSGRPVTLIGYSGGAQIAVGAARYLNQALRTPIRVVSVGGVLTDDPGIAYVEHLYHLDGARDSAPRIGAILYPGRWPLLAYSPWNRAQREGRITVIAPGPMEHVGRRDYFSGSATLPSGQTHADRTADIVADIVAASSKRQMGLAFGLGGRELEDWVQSIKSETKES